MLANLKIGYLVPGCVVKSLPNHESYLILVTNTESLAFLPKKYANRPYKVGDDIIAAVFLMDDKKIILNQKCPHYYLRLADLVFEPLLSKRKIKIKRVASVLDGTFVKIAVESMNGINPVTACIPYLKNARLYTDATITVVKYSSEITEYIKNSLVPGPVNKIRKVIYSHTNREATVRVDPKYYGLFVGKGGTNVATAAKLVDITIQLLKYTEGAPLNADNDRIDTGRNYD